LAEMVLRLSAAELDPALAADLASRLAAAGVEVIRADATKLPFEDGRFSAVVSFTMLHHLPSAADQDRLFAEAARVLRPGGVFAGTDSLDSDEFRELHVGDICVPIEPSGLAARLEAAGLGEVEVETNDYGVRFRARRSCHVQLPSAGEELLVRFSVGVQVLHAEILSASYGQFSRAIDISLNTGHIGRHQ